jgi:prolipoprotein diacylglyceryltransferase
VFVVLPRRQYVGQLLVHWLALYAVARTALELFRGDEERGFVVRVVLEPLNTLLGVPAGVPLFLSTSQTIALGMFALALGIRWWARRRTHLQGG